MKNNKGFTMVEVLGAMIIMGIVLGLVIPGVSHLMKQFRNDYYNKTEQSITEAAKDFFNDNRIYKPNGALHSQKVNIETLIAKKYINEVKDYKGNNCPESYVIAIYKGNNIYDYHTCLKCGNEYKSIDNNSKYCDPAWENNNLSYEFGEGTNYYFYYGTSREVIREELLQVLNVVKKYDNGEVIERVEIGSKDEGVLPTNIDAIDTTPNMGNNYMYEIPLHYRIDGKDINDLSIIIYRHMAPKVEITKLNGSTYVNGSWSNGVIVKLSLQDMDLINKIKEFKEDYTLSYQMYNEIDKKWEDISCTMTSEGTCSFNIKDKNINTNFKFRVVNNLGQTGKETDPINIKIDIDKPKVSINPNGGEFIVSSGNSGTIAFTLNATDTTGGSGVSVRKYAISTSNTKVPSEFNSFTNDSLIEETLTGNIYYVWAQAIDGAGNVSTEVWPSNSFLTKYQVSYDANGGTNAPSIQYKSHGTDLKLSSTIPTKAGFKFMGWYADRTYESTKYEPGSYYTQDKAIILFALYEEIKYTVTFDANGGTSTSTSTTVSQGLPVMLPFATRDGYKFTGWFTSKTDGTNVGYPGNSYYPTQDITLYAMWEEYKTYTIKYCVDKDCKNTGESNVPQDTICEVDKDCILRDNTFTMAAYHPSGDRGWDTTYGATISARSSIAYKNQATVKNLAAAGETIKLYSVYYCNGGARALNTTKKTNQSRWPWNLVTLNEDGTLNSKKANYGCSAVHTDDAQTCIYDRAYITRTWEGYHEACRYCGKVLDWWLCPVHYSGSQDVGGGGGSVAICDVDNKVYSSLDYCTRAKQEGNWTKVNIYTITFDANGGTVINRKGESVSKISQWVTSTVGVYGQLPTPTRSGYTFIGWYTTTSATKKVNASDKLASQASHTLYAIWQ